MLTAGEAAQRLYQLTVWCQDGCRAGRRVDLAKLPPDLDLETGWTRFRCAKCGGKASGITVTASLGVEPVLRLGR